MLGVGAWCSAGVLLALREHFVYQYVVHRDLPMGDGAPGGALLALAAIGAGLAAAAVAAARRGDESKRSGQRALLWMASCAAIAALEQLRRLGAALPTTFLEPLYFAFATSMAVWAMRPVSESLPAGGDFPAAGDARRRARAAWNRPAFWRLCLTALVTLSVAWWFYQGEQSYADYQLGYPDFAEYAHRVVNTWQGRGFLARPPNWPVFFDHFNPGLALLAPLWGLWPDARLVILVQAIALAAPAAFVAGLARRFGAGPAGAVAWAAAYLVLPVVGQLNLSYSYGFHPVSLALLTVTAAIWAAFARRPWLALILGVVSCSFEESVFVALAGMSLAIATVEFQRRREGRGERGEGREATRALAQDTSPQRKQDTSPQRKQDTSPLRKQDTSPQRKQGTGRQRKRGTSPQRKPGDAVPGPSLALRASEQDACNTSPTGLPAWVWLSAAVCFALMFVLVVHFVGLGEGTLRWRFANLGENLTAAAFSPVLRPKAFWGQVFRAQSLYFVLSLCVPAGLLFVVRGWRALLGLAAPLMVLLSWSVDGSTCIALQYVTLLVPCLVLAALLGAESAALRPSRCHTLARSASKGPGQGVSKGPGQGVSKGPGQGVSEGPGQGVSEGPGQGASKGLGQSASEGESLPRLRFGLVSGRPAAEKLMAAAGISVLAGGTVASIFFGALPVSRPTIPFTMTAKDRAALRPRLAILDHAVEMAAKPDAAVLASCRLAAHLLNVRRPEDVNFALRKLDALTEQAQRENRRRWIEVFDFVAVDLKDRDWNHSLADLKRVVFEAEAAGYQAVLAARGIVVYRRPQADLPLQDALRPWRVSPAEAARLAEKAPPLPVETPGLRVLRLAVTPVSLPGAAKPSHPKANLEVVLQATRDYPPECCFRYTLADTDGAVVAETGLRLSADGNRPNSWWRKGEAWRDRLSIDLPAGKTPVALHGRLEVLPLEPLLRPGGAAGR